MAFSTEEKNIIMILTIEKYQKLRKLSMEEVAAAAGLSVRAFYTRKKNAGNFSVDELRGLVSKLKIPAERLTRYI